jgi:hypothetical protein
MGWMKEPRFLARWLRCGLQAGVVAGLLSCGTVLAFQLSRPAPRLALPHGLDGALILVPAIVALGVFAVCGPVFMAATRGEAILGATAAFLVAADVLMASSLVAGDSVMIHPLARSLPLGTVACGLAVPVALAGLLTSQLGARLGFGRSAGVRSAVGAAPLVVVVALVGAYLL